MRKVCFLVVHLLCPRTRGLAARLFLVLSFATLGVSSTARAAISAASVVSYNVLDYGAKGDGVTDDTAAINRAINAAGDAGGGTVYFPFGTYAVNTQSVGDRPIRTRSRVHLVGDGPRGSVLRFPPGETPAERLRLKNRSVIVIGDPSYCDPVTGNPMNIDRWQEDIEISNLGFDLVNGRGRRALQLRYPARFVHIHDCEGFQSGLENGEVPDITVGDNQFFSLACFGAPRDNGIDPSWVDVAQNVTLDHCIVNGRMQLTSDGLYGVKKLWIHHNKVYDPVSYGIAITSVCLNSVFDDIVIEDNEIYRPLTMGIYVGLDDGVRGTMGGPNPIVENQPSILKHLRIRRNLVQLGPYVSNDRTLLTSTNWHGSSATAGGVGLGNMLIRMSDIVIENNLLEGHAETQPTDRCAILVAPWDVDWSVNRSKGARVVLSAADFDVVQNVVRMPGHQLASGMMVQFRPLSSLDRLPSKLSAFSYYRVKRIDASRFALVDAVSGLPVTFGQRRLLTSRFQVSFTPVCEDLVVNHNTVTGVWDRSYYLLGSLNATITGNSFEGRGTIVGEHQNLDFNNNNCSGRMEVSNTSWRSVRIDSNVWNVDESNMGTMWSPGLIRFNPNDLRRSMEFIFSRNEIYFSPSSQKVIGAALNDQAAIGSVTASYLANTVVDPKARGVALMPNHIVSWWENVGFDNQCGSVAPAAPK